MNYPKPLTKTLLILLSIGTIIVSTVVVLTNQKTDNSLKIEEIIVAEGFELTKVVSAKDSSENIVLTPQLAEGLEIVDNKFQIKLATSSGLELTKDGLRIADLGSLKGETGENGINGEKGDPGTKGRDGANGINGTDGDDALADGNLILADEKYILSSQTLIKFSDPNQVGFYASSDGNASLSKQLLYLNGEESPNYLDIGSSTNSTNLNVFGNTTSNNLVLGTSGGGYGYISGYTGENGLIFRPSGDTEIKFQDSLGTDLAWFYGGAGVGDGSLTVKGTTSNSTSGALTVINSSDSNLLYVRNDGKVGIGTNSLKTLSTGGVAGLTVDSSGLALKNGTAGIEMAIDPGEFPRIEFYENNNLNYLIGRWDDNAQALNIETRINEPIVFTTNGAERVIISNTFEGEDAFVTKSKPDWGHQVNIGFFETYPQFHMHNDADASDLYITNELDGTWFYQSIDKPFYFYTNDIERMRIGANGGVAIGTDTITTGFITEFGGRIKTDGIKLDTSTVASYATCDANQLGSIAVLGSDTSSPCYCNGSNWVHMNNYSTICTD